MYVYIRSETTLWTVGFYQPNGRCEPESDHGNPEEAASRVAWLNGSRGVPDPDPTTPDGIDEATYSQGDFAVGPPEPNER